MTPKQIADECERLFQLRGPKVFAFDPERGTVRSSPWGALRTIRLAEPGMQIWARRKVPKEFRYEWRMVGVAK